MKVSAMISDVEIRKEDHTFDPANHFSKVVPVEFQLDLGELEDLSEDEIHGELETLLNEIRASL